MCRSWWHYEVATADNTHLLAIFDAPIPEVILGSDIARLTPTSVMAHTYCLDEALIKEALAPIKQSLFIGPPADCQKSQTRTQGAAVQDIYPGFNGQIAPNQPYFNPGYNMQQNGYHYSHAQRPVIGNGGRVPLY